MAHPYKAGDDYLVSELDYGLAADLLTAKHDPASDQRHQRILRAFLHRLPLPIRLIVAAPILIYGLIKYDP